MLLSVGALDLFALGHALVAGIGKHVGLFFVDLFAGLRDVMDIGGRTHHGVSQARVGVSATVRLDAEVPPVTLLGRAHLEVTLPIFFLGRTRCFNQRSIDRRTLSPQQAFVDERGVDGGQDMFRQFVLSEQVPESQDANAVSNALNAEKTHKLPLQGRLEPGFFRRQVGQAETLLDDVNAQHDLQLERRASVLCSRCMQRKQRQQPRSRHYQVYLVRKRGLARAPFAHVQTKVLLLYGALLSDPA
jgi:hypothetical protein